MIFQDLFLEHLEVEINIILTFSFQRTISLDGSRLRIISQHACPIGLQWLALRAWASRQFSLGALNHWQICPGEPLQMRRIDKPKWSRGTSRGSHKRWNISSLPPSPSPAALAPSPWLSSSPPPPTLLLLLLLPWIESASIFANQWLRRGIKSPRRRDNIGDMNL